MITRSPSMERKVKVTDTPEVLDDPLTVDKAIKWMKDVVLWIDGLTGEDRVDG